MNVALNTPAVVDIAHAKPIFGAQRDYPAFNAPVAPGGYAWWYADGVSDDGGFGFTVIAFVGSVFSPYYATAKRRATVDPTNYCALNVALYGNGGKHWAMTERARRDVSMNATQFNVGPSALRWQDDTLLVDINEWTVPVPRRLRGTIRLSLPPLADSVFALDREHHHHWWPVGACSRVAVDFSSPRQRWQGDAYVDMNWGDRPLESDLGYWCWSRHKVAIGTAITYDVHGLGRNPSTSSDTTIAVTVDRNGRVSRREPAPTATLPNTLWRVPRYTRSENRSAKVVKTLEDTPFYSRSWIEARIDGEDNIGVHESLSLTRFKQPAIRALLPFRMPRAFW